MIRTCNDGNVCTRYYHTPRCAGLCLPVPPSAYKIPNRSLEKYSGVLAPTSSMLFLARPMSYRTSHVPSIVELFTRSEVAYPSVATAAKYCREPLWDGNVCGTTQYGRAKSWLSLAAYLPIRPARLDIVIIRLIVASVLWGLEPYDGIHRRKPCVRSRTFDTRIFSPLLYRLSYVSKYGTR